MRIVELLIEELEELSGFTEVALVRDPAIELPFFAFKENKIEDAIAFQIIKQLMKDEFVEKIPGESRDDYMGRCMPKLKSEGYSEEQAAAICYDSFDIDVTGLPDYASTGSYDAHELHYNVSVVKTDDGNKYAINGEITADIHLVTGNTYCFDQSDESNQEHPLRISETKDGTHNGGEEYTNGVAVMGDKLYIQVTEDTPKELYYFCLNHSGMGGDSKITINEKDEFISYTDYPASATNAARRALEWRDKNGTECGTRVGWARANQLANKRPISEDTIARMASFKRHQQHKDVPYSEGCGGLVYDCWGGTAGIEWASRKLEEIREGLSQEFSHFNELPSNIQEKLLENLSKTGISRDSLIKDGYVIEDYEESPNLTFALPTKADANPDKQTNDTSGQFKILYEYVGPKDSKNRSFCRRLLDLDSLFRKEDIDRMTIKGANSEEFGFYNIFRYKGSFNCRHSWRKKRVYQKQENNPSSIKSIIPRVTDLPSANVAPGVNAGISDDRAAGFSKYNFGMDQDQKIVVGPLMVPNRLIFRVDENDEPYYVYFSEETIMKMSQKMMKEKLLDKMNLEHDPGTPIKGHMIETWLVEDEMNDKSNAYGMNLPKGTWVGAYQIEDDEIWNLVKNGTVTGFSLEGFYESKFIQN